MLDDELHDVGVHHAEHDEEPNVVEQAIHRPIH